MYLYYKKNPTSYPILTPKHHWNIKKLIEKNLKHIRLFLASRK